MAWLGRLEEDYEGLHLPPLDLELVGGEGELMGGDKGLHLAPLDLELVSGEGERVDVSKLLLSAIRYIEFLGLTLFITRYLKSLDAVNGFQQKRVTYSFTSD